MSEVLAYFTRKAPDYNQSCQKFLQGKFKNLEWNWVRNILKNSSGSRVLDLGAGSGFYASRLHNELGMELTCVDFSEAMLNEIEGADIRRIKSDIESLELHEEFDIVLCLGVLEFLKNPHEALEKFFRFIAPGGKLVLLVPLNSFSSTIYRWLHSRHGMNINTFSESRIEECARKYGLTSAKVTSLLGFNAIFVIEKKIAS